MRREDLLSDAGKFGIDLSSRQVEQFSVYHQMLEDWNKRINLTRISADDFVSLHFIDSLSIAKHLDLKKYGDLIDVGCGAGFPGIPLKIAFPHVNLTLLDARNKKVQFLKAVCSELAFEGYRCHHGRAEQLSATGEFYQKYDLVTARAVSNLADLIPLLVPFATLSASIVAMKGPEVDKELSAAQLAIKNANLHVQDIFEFELPRRNEKRSLVVLERNGIDCD